MNANQVLSDLFLEQEAILTFNNACILQLVAMLLTSCVIFNCYSGSTSSYLFIYRDFYRLSWWANLTPIRKRIERNLKLKTAWGEYVDGIVLSYPRSADIIYRAKGRAKNHSLYLGS